MKNEFWKPIYPHKNRPNTKIEENESSEIEKDIEIRQSQITKFILADDNTLYLTAHQFS